jgi:hypothetical protein
MDLDMLGLGHLASTVSISKMGDDLLTHLENIVLQNNPPGLMPQH